MCLVYECVSSDRVVEIPSQARLEVAARTAIASPVVSDALTRDAVARFLIIRASSRGYVLLERCMTSCIYLKRPGATRERCESRVDAGAGDYAERKSMQVSKVPARPHTDEWRRRAGSYLALPAPLWRAPSGRKEDACAFVIS
jgi:hypothetical protein